MSHFLGASSDPQTMILKSLVALGGSAPLEELTALLENSFAIWQRLDQGGEGWDRKALERDLESLGQAELVDIEPDDRITVTELRRYAGESGIEVRSVTQVSSLLRYLPAGAAISEEDLVALAQVTVELDAIYLPVARKARQEQLRWAPTANRFGVNHLLLNGFHIGGGDPLARAKRAAAALLFVSELPIANIEAQLMQHMRGGAVAGPIRAVAVRTRDVIDAVAITCRVRGYQLPDQAAISDLGVRLEIGLPAQMGSLAAQLGVRLTRGQYLELLSRGLTSAEALLAGTRELQALLGDELAQGIQRAVQKPKTAEARSPAIKL